MYAKGLGVQIPIHKQGEDLSRAQEKEGDKKVSPVSISKCFRSFFPALRTAHVRGARAWTVGKRCILKMIIYQLLLSPSSFFFLSCCCHSLVFRSYRSVYCDHGGRIDRRVTYCPERAHALRELAANLVLHSWRLLYLFFYFLLFPRRPTTPKCIEWGHAFPAEEHLRYNIANFTTIMNHLLVSCKWC